MCDYALSPHSCRDRGWRTFAATLEANDSDPQARLSIRMSGGGEMLVDCVSLMPEDAVCGLFRRDLIERPAAALACHLPHPPQLRRALTPLARSRAIKRPAMRKVEA